ncbi:carboxylesterase family protein [Gordonia sp. VNK21]|uniref:carboxylesterase family protein n=1 Tax=Gordonia sp. VNK21 TaxID=3382483 RepID=UPI0038D41D37
MIDDAETVEFHTAAGTVIGRVAGECVRATGIRYAQADRFAAPTPLPASAEPIRALTSSPPCPQPPAAHLDAMFPGSTESTPQSEDCLRLSVTAPHRPQIPPAALPVMVFVHGGSYVNGSADLPMYRPIRLVEEQQVVVVNMQYRLGLFGFLGDLDSTGPRPANLGLLDLIAGLRWIAANIAPFGGDPDNVTLFGHSAGAEAIARLMIADGTAGLFRRAILQSPPLGIPWDRPEMSRAAAAATAHLDSGSTVDEVLAGYGTVTETAAQFGPLIGSMPMRPQFGAHPLPAAGEAGTAHRAVAPAIDLLIGSTAREAAFLLDEIRQSVPVLRRAERIPLLGRAITAAVVGAGGQLIYDRGIDRLARIHRRAGGRVVRYRVAWGPRRNPLRSAHGTELPFLLGDETAWRATPLLAGSSWTQVHEKGRLLRRMWADFARNGQTPREIDGLFRVHEPAAARVTNVRFSGIGPHIRTDL